MVVSPRHCHVTDLVNIRLGVSTATPGFVFRNFDNTIICRHFCIYNALIARIVEYNLQNGIYMDKRERSAVFKARLAEAMAMKKFQKALARDISVDRSTIGQLLNDDMPRLPNAQLAADAAQALSVSTDWLLGLTNRSERPLGDIIAAAIALSQRIEPQQMNNCWNGTGRLLAIRFAMYLHASRFVENARNACLGISKLWRGAVAIAISAMQDQREWLMSGISEYEIAILFTRLRSCASGTAYYKR